MGRIAISINMPYDTINSNDGITENYLPRVKDYALSISSDAIGDGYHNIRDIIQMIPYLSSGVIRNLYASIIEYEHYDSVRIVDWFGHIGLYELIHDYIIPELNKRGEFNAYENEMTNYVKEKKNTN